MAESLLATFAIFIASHAAWAQLGTATLDGISVNIPSLYVIGDARDPDGILGMEFRGRRITEDVRIAPVRLLKAVDDRGTTLEWNETATTPPNQGRWQFITLKHCSRSLIWIALEGEVELLTPSVPYPVFTNFMSRRDGTLSHPTLERHEIQLEWMRPEDSSPGDFQIHLKDPRGRFLGMTFQWPDGSDASSFIRSKGSFSLDGRTKIFAYSCLRPTPVPLNLKVRLAVEPKSETLPFKVKIRPPWIDPENLEVNVVNVRASKDVGADTSCYWTSLAFTGGPLTNAAGIRRLRIARAESRAGEKMELRPSERGWLDAFAPRGSRESGKGGTAVKLVLLHMKAASNDAIGLLEGDVELFRPALTNNAILEITNHFTSRAPLEHPVLLRSGVKITFLGRDNFQSKTNEWSRSPAGRMISGGFYDAPPEVEDSLLFSIEDPDRLVLPVEGSEMTFLDDSGGVLSPKITASSATSRLYTFGTIPKIARARLYLATPESLQRVSFRVENVPLP